MERAAWLERRFGAAIDWRPFDLHPEYPPQGISRVELESRYGGDRWRRRLAEMFEAAGLPWSRDIDRVPNSRKALRLTELARERGVAQALHERLFDSYWARARDIGDDTVLLEEATAAGLDETEVRAVLGTDRYLDQLQRETARALEIGAGGVPAWLIDDRLLVPGAQPREVFERVLAQLGHQPGPGDEPGPGG